jgi:hypothetical protein
MDDQENVFSMETVFYHTPSTLVIERAFGLFDTGAGEDESVYESLTSVGDEVGDDSGVSDRVEVEYTAESNREYEIGLVDPCLQMVRAEGGGDPVQPHEQQTPTSKVADVFTQS